jgi:hypothetical protein
MNPSQQSLSCVDRRLVRHRNLLTISALFTRIVTTFPLLMRMNAFGANSVATAPDVVCAAASVTPGSRKPSSTPLDRVAETFRNSRREAGDEGYDTVAIVRPPSASGRRPA